MREANGLWMTGQKVSADVSASPTSLSFFVLFCPVLFRLVRKLTSNQEEDLLMPKINSLVNVFQSL